MTFSIENCTCLAFSTIMDFFLSAILSPLFLKSFHLVCVLGFGRFTSFLEDKAYIFIVALFILGGDEF